MTPPRPPALNFSGKAQCPVKKETYIIIYTVIAPSRTVILRAGELSKQRSINLKTNLMAIWIMSITDWNK